APRMADVVESVGCQFGLVLLTDQQRTGQEHVGYFMVFIIKRGCRVNADALSDDQQNRIGAVRRLFSAVDHFAGHFDVIPCAAILHVEKSAVYGYQRILFRGKFRRSPELYRIGGQKNPLSVFPEVDFNKVNLLLAVKKIVKMSLLPADAFRSEERRVGKEYSNG